MRNESTRQRGSFSPCTLASRPCMEARASGRSGFCSSEDDKVEPEDDDGDDDGDDKV